MEKSLYSVIYDVLNKHDTISRGLATEKQQQCRSVCVFDVLDRHRSNYLSFILFPPFSFFDFSFITAYSIYGTFEYLKRMQNIRLNPILGAKHSNMDVKL